MQSLRPSGCGESCIRRHRARLVHLYLARRHSRHPPGSLQRSPPGWDLVARSLNNRLCQICHTLVDKHGYRFRRRSNLWTSNADEHRGAKSPWVKSADAEGIGTCRRASRSGPRCSRPGQCADRGRDSRLRSGENRLPPRLHVPRHRDHKGFVCGAGEQPGAVGRMRPEGAQPGAGLKGPAQGRTRLTRPTIPIIYFSSFSLFLVGEMRENGACEVW